MLEGSRHVPRAKVEERDPLQGPDPHRIKTQRLSPSIECSGQVSLIAQDPAQQVVRISQCGIPSQSAPRHLVGGIELPPAPEGFAQLQKRQAARVVGEPGCQGVDVIPRGSSPAPPPGFQPLVAGDRLRVPGPPPKAFEYPGVTSSSKFRRPPGSGPAPPGKLPSVSWPQA